MMPLAEIRARAELMQLTQEFLRREIEERRRQIDLCVGQLYPSILSDEIEELNLLLQSGSTS